MMKTIKSYQSKTIDRLREENTLLQAEISDLKEQLRSANEELTLAEYKYNELNQVYNKYMSGYSERIEALAELQLRYEAIFEKCRDAGRQYTKQVGEYVNDIKRQSRRW